MTVYELAKKVHKEGCEITISPREDFGAVVVIEASKGERKYGMPLALYPSFSEDEDMIDDTIKMLLYQVR